jgi:hypothetical protein
MKNILLLLSSILILVLVTSSLARPIYTGGYEPVVVAPTASTAVAGTAVTWTVTLDHAVNSTDGPGVVLLSCAPTGAFTNLPSSVTVASGQTSASFSATLASTISGDVVVTGVISNRSKAGTVAVVPPPPPVD